ncbi:phosphoenolpyruvate--protein phosphotransferase [Marispirochaeta sp.]|jgi:phosphotransferase system, enzyme I, PtsP|uniref:phosphoenolpyruvate--protein phosphotransferase n=1 Tax=Marispirochaeta sp. TaxID=2038653 RepID=UPI0029C8CA87|nr:phosphoenolpyruvate--protein phosphotransferase [Marispirochaeta sp.]
MERKAIDLICSVAELTSLFERQKSIEEFLDQTVNLIAQHMGTDLCSIFIVDSQSGLLFLRASTGLNPEAIGNLTLKPGEGITGTALKELRPIILPRAKDSPHFKAVPDLHEEEYEAFLAVPIIHGLRRIGVIVCQQRKVGYFSTRDARALTAIAAQMAAMIENALLLMELHGERLKKKPETAGEIPPFLHGQQTTPGIAIGRSYYLGRSGADSLLSWDSTVQYRQTLEDFRQAVESTKRQIQSLQKQLKEHFADVGSLIFHAHLLMLTDKAFTGEMEQRILNGEAPEEAVASVVNNYIRLFAEAEAASVREKVQDLKDLGHRLLLNLTRDEGETEDYKETIILTEELYPSELIKFAAQGAAGIVLHKASITSHLRILGLSIKIPMVSIEDKKLFTMQDGIPLVIDGFHGTVFIDPDDETRDRFVQLAKEHAELESSTKIEPEIPLSDGSSVSLLANVGLLGDLQVAAGYGIQGIGLYRSEFPFLIRNDFPSEEEQYRIYRRIFDTFTNGPVYMRILDMGGDKQLGFLTDKAESNPFLGLRAIRFTLKNPEILLTQLRAILRAGLNGDLYIIVPFVSGIEEIQQIRRMMNSASAELTEQGIEHHTSPKLGIMVELPSTGFILDELADEVDFMSIGTNDLVQYLLGVDRTNTSVSGYYEPFHPAVLRFIAKVAEVCNVRRIPLSVCGDSAADKFMASFLIGLGIRVFSIAPGSAPGIYEWIKNKRDVHQHRDFCRHLLKLGSSQAIREYLDSSRA